MKAYFVSTKTIDWYITKNVRGFYQISEKKKQNMIMTLRHKRRLLTEHCGPYIVKVKLISTMKRGHNSGCNLPLGHVAALVRSHAIGLLPFRLTKEQTTQTMDPSPKTIELLYYPGQ